MFFLLFLLIAWLYACDAFYHGFITPLMRNSASSITGSRVRVRVSQRLWDRPRSLLPVPINEENNIGYNGAQMDLWARTWTEELCPGCVEAPICAPRLLEITCAIRAASWRGVGLAPPIKLSSAECGYRVRRIENSSFVYKNRKKVLSRVPASAKYRQNSRFCTFCQF